MFWIVLRSGWSAREDDLLRDFGLSFFVVK